ncbi:MAG: hypothetical protein J5586_02830 [Clostridia bacterium]|nr:hypothetical protein [Clostridia bacterium]
MQRIPSRNVPRQAGSGQPAEEPSPLLKLARRIREEQGTDQVRSFLAAMLPFAAPNEIRRAAEGFGIAFDSLEVRPKPAPQKPAYEPQPRQSAYSAPQMMESMLPREAMNSLNMIRTLMQLKSAMAGGDPMKLMNGIMGR